VLSFDFRSNINTERKSSSKKQLSKNYHISFVLFLQIINNKMALHLTNFSGTNATLCILDLSLDLEFPYEIERNEKERLERKRNLEGIAAINCNGSGPLQPTSFVGCTPHKLEVLAAQSFRVYALRLPNAQALAAAQEAVRKLPTVFRNLIKMSDWYFSEKFYGVLTGWEEDHGH
jgi:hypothetical protein